MQLKTETKRRLIAGGAFAAVVALGILGGFLFGLVPSFEQRCMEQCRADGKTSQVLPLYPKTMTGQKSEGFFQKKCECL